MHSRYPRVGSRKWTLGLRSAEQGLPSLELQLPPPVPLQRMDSSHLEVPQGAEGRRKGKLYRSHHACFWGRRQAGE